MDDSKSVLLDQITYWKNKLQEARDATRVAEAVLPGLEETLRRIDGAVQDTATVLPKKASATPAPEEGTAQDGGNNGSTTVYEDLTELRDADEVQTGISAVISDLPRRFTQNDVERAINSIGCRVNRSTLRSNLLILARAKEGVEVESEGRGRRATVFRRV